MSPSPSEFDPADQALERELQNLQPNPPSDALVERVTRTLSENQTMSFDSALERELEAVRPVPVSASLLTRIESALECADSNVLAETPNNVVSMPQWRDFTPIFRVAAVIAVCVGIVAMWVSPPSTSTPDTVMQPSNPAVSNGPTLRSLQPVSVNGDLIQRSYLWEHGGGNMVIQDEGVLETPRSQKAY